MRSLCLASISATSVLILAGAAGADVVRTSDPSGLATVVAMDGAAGVPSNPASWFVGEEGASLYTYWAGDLVRYQASLPGSVAPWRLGVTARNVSGPLDPAYSDFSVSIAVNGSSAGTLLIPASDAQWRTAWIDLGARSGPTEVTLSWQNDAWNPGISDANISLGALQFSSRAVPTPGTGVLVGFALGLCALRVRRAP